MRTLWITVAVLALLSFSAAAFARTNNADNVPDASGTDSLAGDANVTYAVPMGDPTSWSGYYNPKGTLGGDDSLPLAWFDNTSTGPDTINVIADVVLWATDNMAHSEFYFHIADATTSLATSIEGTLASNTGEYLALAMPDDCDANLLTMTENYRGAAPTGTPPTIPVLWHMSEYLGGVWTPYRTADSLGSMGSDGTYGPADWWLLDGGSAGSHRYSFRCTITPDAYQKPGRYVLDPMVVAAPEL